MRRPRMKSSALWLFATVESFGKHTCPQEATQHPQCMRLAAYSMWLLPRAEAKLGTKSGDAYVAFRLPPDAL